VSPFLQKAAGRARFVQDPITHLCFYLFPNVIACSISITLVNTFADRLRLARTRLGWTQKQLAQASGLSQSAIGNYESGQRFSSRALLRLAHALQVTPQWLEGGGPTAYPPPAHALDEAAGEPWPFADVPYRDYTLLTQRDKTLLENTVRAFVRACHDAYRESGRPPGARPGSGRGKA